MPTGVDERQAPSTEKTPDARAFLISVYRWMGLGLIVTGVVAAIIGLVPGLATKLFHRSIFFFGVIVAQVLLVLVMAGLAEKMKPGKALALFLLYAAFNGLIFSVLLKLYTAASVAVAFFVSAVSFGILSYYGSMTRRDLTSWGNMGLFGLVGLILGTSANLVLGGNRAQWITTYAGMIIFFLLTVFNAQKLKTMAATARSAGDAINAAFILYLDFINLFFKWIDLTGKPRKQ